MSGKRLKILLIEYNMSVKQLALKIGLSTHTIYAYIEGKKTMFDHTIKKISKIFNVSERFITGEEHLLRR